MAQFQKVMALYEAENNSAATWADDNKSKKQCTMTLRFEEPSENQTREAEIGGSTEY